MGDISCRIENTSGIITLQRPQSLNALTYDMCSQIETSLIEWKSNKDVSVVIIEAEGDKAFCAGGDVAQLYHRGRANDLKYINNFWKDEYRLNAMIANYPKPYIAFMNGYNMGGGVGISCHGSHRIVGESSKIAMPECAIGLIPDVGGTLLLAKSPGKLGELLGTTGIRMESLEAIKTGFADYFVPEKHWEELKKKIISSGTIDNIKNYCEKPPIIESNLFNNLNEINEYFKSETVYDIEKNLKTSNNDFTKKILKMWKKNSPLSIFCTIEIIKKVRKNPKIEFALEQEFIFTSNSIKHGDFLEGVRAALIDKDHNPKWKHENIYEIDAEDKKLLLGK